MLPPVIRSGLVSKNHMVPLLDPDIRVFSIRGLRAVLLAQAHRERWSALLSQSRAEWRSSNICTKGPEKLVGQNAAPGDKEWTCVKKSHGPSVGSRDTGLFDTGLARTGTQAHVLCASQLRSLERR